MHILSFTGSPNPPYPPENPISRPRMFALLPSWMHDAAAVVLQDGQVVAAVEEERLSRMKHTNSFPAHALRQCLRMTGLQLTDFDRIAYYSAEPAVDRMSHMVNRRNALLAPPGGGREYLAGVLEDVCKVRPDPARLTFVDHHEAHAMSAFAMSPFERSLVVTLDGSGDMLSGSVSSGEKGGRLTRTVAMGVQLSLGNFYVNMIDILGYRGFDEYKVMGLAPYGDPARFRSIFDEICTLQEAGEYRIHENKFPLLRCLWPHRGPDDPFTQEHKDFAASLQEALERVVFHVLTYHRDRTGHRNLCLAGGVAHNSSMVGKLVNAGLFDGVFVQPAASDAGCALGAALVAHQQAAGGLRTESLTHVYWGTDIGESGTVKRQLDRWSRMLEITPLVDVPLEAARLLAEGHVLGWVQGRAEFGPRALGNRSILADPRPIENKERINALVKKREAYRPFAPSVMEEHAGEFFEVPKGGSYAFMTTVVSVQEHARALLGAVTHVDGTARVQTVSRTTNPRFWSLLDAFNRQTGVPILLNTSFNHSVEPIVDSVDDALVCLLTTGLTHVIVGEYLVTKRPLDAASFAELVPSLPVYARLICSRQNDDQGQLHSILRCETAFSPWRSRIVSAAVYDALVRADGRTSLRELLRGAPSEEIVQELRDLWSDRLIRLLPAAEAPAPAG